MWFKGVLTLTICFNHSKTVRDRYARSRSAIRVGDRTCNRVRIPSIGIFWRNIIGNLLNKDADIVYKHAACSCSNIDTATQSNTRCWWHILKVDSIRSPCRNR